MAKFIRYGKEKFNSDDDGNELILPKSNKYHQIILGKVIQQELLLQS